MKFIVVVSSEITITLLIGGATAHYPFKIPMDTRETSTCNLAMESVYEQKLIDADFFVSDEIVMIHKCCVEAVDRLLKEVLRTTYPIHVISFGHK